MKASARPPARYVGVAAGIGPPRKWVGAKTMNDLTPKSTHGRHSVGETLAFTAIRSKGLRAAKALKGRGIIIEGARAYVIGCSEQSADLQLRRPPASR